MPSTRAVAFFRNLNLGQARSHSPTRVQLIGAFASAGAPGAVSFQTNGTVLFEAIDPGAVAAEVVARLTPVCGYADVVLVRPAEVVLEVAEQLAELPETAELALFDGAPDLLEPLPWTSPRGRLEVVAAADGCALAVNAVEQTSFATPELERLLGVPVTSRGAGTVMRLARRLRELEP